jgi:2-dehydropantoate 2-reductase
MAARRAVAGHPIDLGDIWKISRIREERAMHILVLGAGGIGGYFGGRLAETGAEVTFLLREARARRVEAEGLIVESPLGDIRRKVRVATDANALNAVDVVLLSCKAYDLTTALEAIAPAVGNGTAILPLLNGVAHLDSIATRLPGAAVWGGVAHVSLTLTQEGVVRHLSPLNAISFGRLDGGADARVHELKVLFAKTPVTARALSAPLQDMWDKFVFISTLAGMTCLMRASIGTILALPLGERLILQMLGECQDVAKAEGFAGDGEPTARYRAQLTQTGSPITASMLRDMERGGPTEAEHILGDMTQRAARHGVAAPLTEIALTHMRAYEKLRLERRAPP